MHSILSCLLCLSLISPTYVQKYVPGLYQVKSAQKVYLKPSASSKIVKTLKKGSILAIDAINGQYGLSSDAHGYISLKDCQLQRSVSSLIEGTKVSRKTRQLVIVNGPLQKGRYKVSLWTKKATWQESLSTTKAYIGKNGMKRHRHRGDYTTPIGCFRFTYAFGTHNNPGTPLTYKKLNKRSYWYYGNNTYRESDHVIPGEYLAKSRQAYEYALFINFNEYAKVKQAGGAIFLHCYSGHQYTAGCVAIDRKLMKRYMKTIQPAARIIITPHMQDIKNY